MLGVERTSSYLPDILWYPSQYLLNLFLVSFLFLSLEWYKWPCYWKNCKSVGRLSTSLTNELQVAETNKTGVTYFPKLCVVFKEKVKVKVELFKNILQRVVFVTHILERKQFFSIMTAMLNNWKIVTSVCINTRSPAALLSYRPGSYY